MEWIEDKCNLVAWRASAGQPIRHDAGSTAMASTLTSLSCSSLIAHCPSLN